MSSDTRIEQEYPLIGSTKEFALEAKAWLSDWFEPTPEQKRAMIDKLIGIVNDPESRNRDVCRAVQILSKLTNDKLTHGLKLVELLELDERLKQLEANGRF